VNHDHVPIATASLVAPRSREPDSVSALADRIS
jgi:hypothetical protein